MTHPPTFRQTWLAAVALALAALPALADEYTVETFAGGFSAPPANATEVIGRSQDDRTVAVTLPFSFVYFGRVYTSVSVSSNGWLAFGATTATQSSNPTLPSSAVPNGTVAPLWDDLTTGDGNVSTFTLGTMGARTFVVSWNGVDTFSSAQTSDLSFQVRLHEASSSLELVYASTGSWGGLSYSVGIENDAGNVAFVLPATSGNANAGQPSVDQRFVPNAVSVTGTVLRDRPVADASGLGNSRETDLPVVGAHVALVNPVTRDTLATTLTGVDGGFAVTALGVDDPFTLHVELRASGTESRVTDATGVVYAHRIAANLLATGAPALGTIRIDDTVDVVAPAFGRALNVQQAARRGAVFAEEAAQLAATNVLPQTTSESFSQLEFRWTPNTTVPEGSNYVPAVGTVPARVDVNDANQNADPWDDDIILREYGQHVFAVISFHPGAGARSWDQPSGQEAALVQGFAHWFAAVVQGRPGLVDTRSATQADVYDLEAPHPVPIRLDSVTGAVAASLWDLVDPANESHDRHDGTATGPGSDAMDVFATFDRALDAPPTGTLFTVRDFFFAWRDGGPVADRQAAARNFIHHGTLPDDSREPNDETGEEAAFPQGTQKLLGLRLSPYNEDHFHFNLADPLDDVLVVSLQQETSEAGYAELEVEILDSMGVSLAANTNAGQTGPETVRVSTPGPVPAGDYLVHVRWVSGDFTPTYSLTFANPLRFTALALPEWTQGVAYKQDFAVAGGVPPYSFTMTSPVPGLASALGGSRLTGTPSSAGAYSVAVSVSDDDAPTGAVAADVALTINPPLTLPTHFGIAEGRPFDVPLGRGGTVPDWIAGTLPPAPFVLSGGAELRLFSGVSPDPRTFSIAASATDSVGASLASSTTHVVVAHELDDKLIAPVQGGTGNDRFGVFFDALAGSTARLDVRYSGTGTAPEFLMLIDAAGNVVPTPRARRKVRRFRTGRVALPGTGRYFALFSNLGGPAFAGEFRARIDLDPVRKQHGQDGIVDVGDHFDVPFEGVAGATVDVVLRRGNAPQKVRPVLMAVLGPDGQSITPLPAPRVGKRGRRYAVKGVPLTQSGTHILRIAASDNGPTGAVSWRYKLRIPKGVRYELE